MSLGTAARRAGTSMMAAAAALALATSALAAPVVEEDIRDIRGPIVIPAWWRWPAAAAAVLLSGLVVALALRWWRRRRRQKSPLDRAREALERATTEAIAGRSRAWAEIVAQTLREALAARVGVAVLPQTTSELACAEWATPPRSVDLDAPQILALLERCDVARFARATFDTEALVASTAAAREVTERLFTPDRAPRSPHPTAAEARTQ